MIIKHEASGGLQMNFAEQLDIYLRARFTLIALATSEEERAIEAVRKVCEQTEPELMGPSETERAACHFAWKDNEIPA